MLVAATMAAQEKPLPDRQKLFEATRANLERAQKQQSSYAYTERRRELHTNPFGRLGSGTGTEEYRVEPQPDGSIARTLIARDGVAGDRRTDQPTRGRRGRVPRVDRQWPTLPRRSTSHSITASGAAAAT